MWESMKFRHKILMMPFLAMIAFLLLLFVSQVFMERNNALLNEVEQHFVPALELCHELERTLMDLQRGLQDAVAAAEDEELADADALYLHALQLFEQGGDNTFFKEKSLNTLNAEFESYYTLARKTSQMLIEGGALDQETVADLQAMSEQYNAIKGHLKALVARAKQSSSRTFKSTLDNHQRSSYLMNAIIFCCALFLAGLSMLVVRSVSHPISTTIEVTNQFAEGKTDARIEVKGHDELSELGRAFNRMMDALEIQDWFKTGQTKLNERMRGEQDVATLSRNIITYLATYIQGQIGAVYLMDDERKELRLTGSYAYTERKGNRNTFKPGEGLVGQAALERQRILFSNVPEDYIRVQSGTGEMPPRYLLLLPFLHEEELKGVLEIGTIHEFSSIKLDFLEQVCESIAIALHSAQSRVRMQELLEQTQHQSTELQAQQEALQHTNEHLERQADALKQSEEKLQSQQEELRQTNEELGAQARALEIQKHELKEKNQELERSRTLLEEKASELELTSKYKSEFLANMSHELRTPLNSLLILSKLLLENKDENLTEKQLEFVSTIHASGAELLSLINEVLDLSKVESGKMLLNIEEMSLNGLSAFIEQSFRHVAEERSLELNITLGKELPESILTDRQRIEQVVKNLLSNALKFTEQGHVAVEIRRPLPQEQFFRGDLLPNNAVAIVVNDTGIGIPPQKQQLIFEAFQQADGTTSRKYGGTGLGLSISREIVKLLGGEIHLSSESGKGSTFRVYLPEVLPTQQQGTEQPPERPSKEQPPAARSPQTEVPSALVPLQSSPQVPCLNSEKKPPPPTTSIESIRDDRREIAPMDKIFLIIEDDPKFAKLLFDLARKRGFKGLIAGDGAAGLQLAFQFCPSAIMLDIGLPEMSGWTVMEKLKGNPETRHIPVHFVSGYDKSLQAMQMGAIGYLTKPVTLDILNAAFQKIENTLSRAIKKLLIVESDETMEHTLFELLNAVDVSITRAKSGEEAYKLLQMQEYDCLVVDIGIQENSGFELLEKMQQAENIPHLPIIAYSERELTKTENLQLKKYTQSIIIKGVKSPERLLDEVTLFLQRVEADLPETQQKKLRQLHDKEHVFQNKTLLMVDDDIRNIFALSSVLEEKGLTVIAAEHGKEALELLESHQEVNLVLMDIMMPEMDGYETMRYIRGQEGLTTLPIIALTAKAMKGDRQRCLEAGASDYLSKPVDVDKLLSLLRVWLY